MQPVQTRSLWRDADFLKLWMGRSVSEMGSRITREGLPIIAARLLNVSRLQMGYLAALSSGATLLFGLPLGMWIDRVRRKPVMIAADLGRALLLVSVPIAAWQHSLTLIRLYTVAVLAGILTVCFDVAYQTYLPSLVDRDQILEANSKLALTSATAEIAGPAKSGMLIQLISAPFAILLDSLSFMWSNLCQARRRPLQ